VRSLCLDTKDAIILFGMIIRKAPRTLKVRAGERVAFIHNAIEDQGLSFRNRGAPENTRSLVTSSRLRAGFSLTILKPMLRKVESLFCLAYA
jgi:hypothetical protein